jgi:hypothetical protein
MTQSCTEPLRQWILSNLGPTKKKAKSGETVMMGQKIAKSGEADGETVTLSL